MKISQLKYLETIAYCKSFNKASKVLFISQPTLSQSIKELEEEIDITIFKRTNRGITLTTKGKEFLGYANQVLKDYELLEEKFVNKLSQKESFSISLQHYTFVVEAFIKLIKNKGFDNYDFEVHETKTREVIENVKNYRSEIGVVYLDDYNQSVLLRIIEENHLEFTPLFACPVSVYISTKHPLANKKIITLEELEQFPCLKFDQGDNDSIYLAEEVYSSYKHPKIIRANDRATFLNLMMGLDAYTLCSGLISSNLNGDNYKSVPLDSDKKMIIGYVKRKSHNLSVLATEFIKMLKEYNA